MFIALYQFKVKPGRESAFQEAWHAGTAGIYKARGSLGSRLHKTEEGAYLAYAQWPSAEHYDRKDELPEEVRSALALMRDCCESVTLLERMTVVDDLLASGGATDAV